MRTHGRAHAFSGRAQVVHTGVHLEKHRLTAVPYWRTVVRLVLQQSTARKMHEMANQNTSNCNHTPNIHSQHFKHHHSSFTCNMHHQTWNLPWDHLFSLSKAIHANMHASRVEICHPNQHARPYNYLKQSSTCKEHIHGIKKHKTCRETQGKGKRTLTSLHALKSSLKSLISWLSNRIGS